MESKPRATVRNRSAKVSLAGQKALPFDLAKAVKTIAKADPTMARVIKAVGPCELELQAMLNCFESLLESIVFQQLTAKAASTIMRRVKALYKNKFPTPSQILRTETDDLRLAGLSGAKALALRDLAEKTENGILPLIDELSEMTDEEIIETFSSVRGIGEWTVQMLLIFRLGRPDVMPAKDLGLRKGFARAYKLAETPAPAYLYSQAECWRPYRTVASWYLWRVPQ